MDNSFLPPVSQRSKQFANLNGVGHRGRMRFKMLQKGGQAFEDYELLEMLLYLVIPRRDTKPLAKHLINHFGSLNGVVCAEEDQLQKANLSQEFIEIIGFLKQVIERLVAPDFFNRPYLRRWKDVIVYLNEYKLKNELHNKKVLRLLFLNNQQRLICDEYIIYQGVETISHIIQKALNLYAMNLITVYYVSDTAFTSAMRQGEAKFALTLQSSGRLFDLNISDHIICMDSQYFSIFKKNNFSI
ncbi:JAB domain-containing protein [Commensalibacter papalotli (ex Botero et al. 2024)]|uniref:Contains a helix-hairpin-helix DNA-binding motif (RadC) (PDB:2QLC) (PUBMED:9695921) n=1 Tax=Commensalibacter papalotli (ex Botero et al. 2024) TaxID=2972766 RepID=A0ABM9HIJ1_9PROT|nr:JAB domain-containing protein [Commensalibacter papalotli (ex Botero et al. 2024)]CAI3925084.1 DNA repair protein RadC [Commensalibacter papalotli (ex Botero et al. 2024)]CAI3927004.1 DNA repair protein RadC [Commensalibacter papalotli (ex Botero et al. 2024)]